MKTKQIIWYSFMCTFVFCGLIVSFYIFGIAYIWGYVTCLLLLGMLFFIEHENNKLKKQIDDSKFLNQVTEDIMNFPFRKSYTYERNILLQNDKNQIKIEINGKTQAIILNDNYTIKEIKDKIFNQPSGKFEFIFYCKNDKINDALTDKLYYLFTESNNNDIIKIITNYKIYNISFYTIEIEDIPKINKIKFLLKFWEIK